jgi:hypothetical protein
MTHLLRPAGNSGHAVRMDFACRTRPSRWDRSGRRTGRHLTMPTMLRRHVVLLRVLETCLAFARTNS